MYDPKLGEDQGGSHDPNNRSQDWQREIQGRPEENEPMEAQDENQCHGPPQEWPMLRDIYGNTVREQLEDIVNVMENQRFYQLLGVKQPQTFLFVGEPGTGKSMGAEAIANELNYREWPKESYLLEYSTGRYGTAYINMGSKILQQFFDQGKKALQEYPNEIHSIIYYFDECDAIMSKRNSDNSGASKEGDKVLDTLMTNMQAINDRADREYIILATNNEKAIDEASLRSGRVDKRVYFALPNYDDRVSALQSFIDEKNERAPHNIVRQYDTEKLAEVTENFNYADLRSVVDGAVQDRITEYLRYKKNNSIPQIFVTQNRLENTAYKISRDKGYKTENKMGF